MALTYKESPTPESSKSTAPKKLESADEQIKSQFAPLPAMMDERTDALWDQGMKDFLKKGGFFSRIKSEPKKI